VSTLEESVWVPPMSNVPIEIDQDALREYLEGLPVFGEGSQTFGDVQRQFDEMERLGIIPAGQTTGESPRWWFHRWRKGYATRYNGSCRTSSWPR
jgi:hypothetical protein